MTERGTSSARQHVPMSKELATPFKPPKERQNSERLCLSSQLTTAMVLLRTGTVRAPADLTCKNQLILQSTVVAQLI
jgi:hypothetical protein